MESCGGAASTGAGAGASTGAGEGALFAGFLKVAPQCSTCGYDLGKADSGDGPAVFVILIAGGTPAALAQAGALGAFANGLVTQRATPGAANAPASSSRITTFRLLLA